MTTYVSVDGKSVDTAFVNPRSVGFVLPGSIVVLAIGAMSGNSVAAEDGLPAGEGKDVVEAVCADCHGLSYVTDARKTREQWQRLVTMMFDQGAPLEEYEIDIVVTYLADHFGTSGAEP